QKSQPPSRRSIPQCHTSTSPKREGEGASFNRMSSIEIAQKAEAGVWQDATRNHPEMCRGCDN
ncbi:MAG: hypothetical protein ACKVHE_35255, partial [Planctomycetales bacterium]